MNLAVRGVEEFYADRLNESVSDDATIANELVGSQGAY